MEPDFYIVIICKLIIQHWKNIRWESHLPGFQQLYLAWKKYQHWTWASYFLLWPFLAFSSFGWKELHPWGKINIFLKGSKRNFISIFEQLVPSASCTYDSIYKPSSLSPKTWRTAKTTRFSLFILTYQIHLQQSLYWRRRNRKSLQNTELLKDFHFSLMCFEISISDGMFQSLP